jgi:hypothetical protein
MVYMFVHRFHFFHENFEIQDGQQRSHDHPIFVHIAISVGHAMEVKKVS